MVQTPGFRRKGTSSLPSEKRLPRSSKTTVSPSFPPELLCPPPCPQFDFKSHLLPKPSPRPPSTQRSPMAPKSLPPYCGLVFIVNSTHHRSTRERGNRTERIASVRLACAHVCERLIVDVRPQTTTGSPIPTRVGLGSVRKLAEHEPESRAGNYSSMVPASRFLP